MNLCCAVPRSWLHHKATFEYFWRRKSVYPPLLEELKHRCESKLGVNLPPLLSGAKQCCIVTLLRPKSSYDYCSVYSGMQHTHQNEPGGSALQTNHFLDTFICQSIFPHRFQDYRFLNPKSRDGVKRSSIHWNSYSYLRVLTIGVGSVFWKVMFRNLTSVHVQTVFQQKLCAIYNWN